MSLQTTVGVAKVGTKSLRATVPDGIVAFLELQEGDKLDWKMDLENGERVVKVRKAISSIEEARRIVAKRVKAKK